jgi:hypothetical protein
MVRASPAAVPAGLVGRGPVYRASLKDGDGFPTVVVAGPTRDRGRVWLYVHDLTPTVLRLRPPVVRFLRDALADVADWLVQPEIGRGVLVWTLPRETPDPECVLVASGWRVWLHVFAASPSVVRLNTRMVAFLLEALADLLVWGANRGRRWTGQPAELPPAWAGQLRDVAP